MLYVLTALKCEAAALTGLPGRVIVTGVGDRCTAALAGLKLNREDRILNIGCCAGKIPGLYLASCIENISSGKRYYPDIRSDSVLPEMKLVTSSTVVTEVEDGLLYDMEAALICEWALKTISPSNICVLKTVSDDGTKMPSANDVTQLIRDHLPEIEEAAKQLADEPAGQDFDTYPEGLADELRLSQYMRNELASLWHYCVVSGRRSEVEGLLDGMREAGRIPVKDKKAGKEILDEIYAHLR